MPWPISTFRISSLEEYPNNIAWWWKNGENKQNYFGVKYEYPENNIRTFYPDYLVAFKNGKVGIFEVKDRNDRDGKTFTKAKAESLYLCIKDQKSKGKKALGGIVIQRDGFWVINQKPSYDWAKCEQNNWDDWESLLNYMA